MAPKGHFHRPCVILPSGFWFRRCFHPKRTFTAALVCALYFFFTQVGLSQRSPTWIIAGRNQVNPKGVLNLGLLNANSAVPTRSNVVYITLKSKRLKPSNIRGTVRPKLRRKARRTTHPHWNIQDGTGAEGPVSSIRIYSRSPPPWLSARDVGTMRALAGAKVLSVQHQPTQEAPWPLLVFEGTRPEDGNAACGLAHGPADSVEVFAFHLDRVLGLNRTLPAVNRKLTFLHDGQPSPVVAWEGPLYPDGVILTWAEYQKSLKQRCWIGNIAPRPESGCSVIHHYEWSRLALFDFLLQIHNRLDPSCCGFKPRQQDGCHQPGRHFECEQRDSIRLANVVHRRDNPHRLVLTVNKGFFDRNEDNLDFMLLEGIKELPEHAVSILRSGRLREKLLQSLFMDQTYWESQGGRLGIDKLIDVVECRAQVLLTYANGHGIRTFHMTE
ncbi:Golgi-associated kinase 1B [Corythoichthys intestinalis]|uniref:Golgi-associated kinase 1B n=1 Tax=Corythoichthys intestinalis TaxID=161448 RepID=UPI0025A64E42|nr:Golgi-associated kinase 1B [Corythoichthys intestinalis]XP_061793304.1 Golgi-associated kinase 1B-like [Nerophis lumbriciformis]